MNPLDCSIEYMRGRREERADVLALLRRRQANAATVLGTGGEFAELAADRARQLAIVIEEIEGGKHLGEADEVAG